jgi:hypothetical protein
VQGSICCRHCLFIFSLSHRGTPSINSSLSAPAARAHRGILTHASCPWAYSSRANLNRRTWPAQSPLSAPLMYNLPDHHHMCATANGVGMRSIGLLGMSNHSWRKTEWGGCACCSAVMLQGVITALLRGRDAVFVTVRGRGRGIAQP